MPMDPKGEGAPPSPPRSLELALRPRWRRAHQVLIWCFMPAGAAAGIGWFATSSSAWSALFFAVGAAEAGVQVLGQRFRAPRLAGAVQMAASLMGMVLSVLPLSPQLIPDFRAALDATLASLACFFIWGLAVVVGALLAVRALHEEGKEQRIASEGVPAPPAPGALTVERAQQVRRVLLGSSLASAAMCGVYAWQQAREGHPNVADVFSVGGAVSVLMCLFGVWWYRPKPPGQRPSA